MKWFGESWEAPVNSYGEHVTAPVGELCFDCQKTIKEEDRGLVIPSLEGTLNAPQWKDRPWHYDCFMKNVLGKSYGSKGEHK
jgi:hypothetical protein